MGGPSVLPSMISESILVRVCVGEVRVKKEQ